MQKDLLARGVADLEAALHEKIVASSSAKAQQESVNKSAQVARRQKAGAQSGRVDVYGVVDVRTFKELDI